MERKRLWSPSGSVSLRFSAANLLLCPHSLASDIDFLCFIFGFYVVLSRRMAKYFYLSFLFPLPHFFFFRLSSFQLTHFLVSDLLAVSSGLSVVSPAGFIPRLRSHYQLSSLRLFSIFKLTYTILSFLFYLQVIFYPLLRW